VLNVNPTRQDKSVFMC